MIIIAMLLYHSFDSDLTGSLPPVGVYLLEGGCDVQVGLNVLCWFLFITPCIIPSPIR